MTYSIVARDPTTGELGIAVQSHSFGVGAAVPATRAGVGAVATQAAGGQHHGAVLLELLDRGHAPSVALDESLAGDLQAPVRQVGVVDVAGRVAAHTGAACIKHAGHAVAEGVVALGNLLTCDSTWQDMVQAYQAARGDLGERLLAALDAGEHCGGDVRGSQSAALVVAGSGEDGTQGLVTDVRVDDNPNPLPELRRLLALDRAWRRMAAALEAVLLGDASPESVVPVLAEVQEQFTDRNLEPSLWTAVMLARGGRTADAEGLVARIAGVQPGLGVLFERLRAAWHLDGSEPSEL